MSPEEKDDLTQIVSAVIADSGRQRDLDRGRRERWIKYWPIVVALTVLIGNYFLVQRDVEDLQEWATNTEGVMTRVGATERGVELLETKLVPVFAHVSLESIHQTAHERTAIAAVTLEPIKLQIQKLQINQEDNSAKISEVLGAVREIQVELRGRGD